jgi:hypothetical protein
VALIRTDVSEDRIASIFRVNECEQVQSERVSSCIGGDSRNTRRHLPEDDNHQGVVSPNHGPIYGAHPGRKRMN